MEIPIVSRAYLTGAFLTTAACALDVVSPFSLYYNYNAIFFEGEVWRLVTNFFFFGMFGIDFVFHMFFSHRACLCLRPFSHLCHGVGLDISDRVVELSLLFPHLLDPGVKLLRGTLFLTMWLSFHTRCSILVLVTLLRIVLFWNLVRVVANCFICIYQ